MKHDSKQVQTENINVISRGIQTETTDCKDKEETKKTSEQDYRKI